MDGKPRGFRTEERGPEATPPALQTEMATRPAHPFRALVSLWMEAPKPTAAAPRFLDFWGGGGESPGVGAAIAP